jgi:hypothetical protein
MFIFTLKTKISQYEEQISQNEINIDEASNEINSLRLKIEENVVSIQSLSVRLFLCKLNLNLIF